jgi:hypothetical protein
MNGKMIAEFIDPACSMILLMGLRVFTRVIEILAVHKVA